MCVFFDSPSVVEVFCRLSHNYQHPPGQGVSIIMAFRVGLASIRWLALAGLAWLAWLGWLGLAGLAWLAWLGVHSSNVSQSFL